jgi:hypothetical protein
MPFEFIAARRITGTEFLQSFGNKHKKPKNITTNPKTTPYQLSTRVRFEFASVRCLFQALYSLKQLLHGILIALRKSKRRFRERLEIHRHIIQPVERTVAFHGIDNTG